MIDSPYLVKPGKKLRLSKYATDDHGHFQDKDDAAAEVEKHLGQLVELQDVLYASGQHAVLIVFQAMDAGGKDGAISHIFSGVNPQGCSVTSFKVPSAEEKAHDYLWRHHLAMPRRGMIGIHNRSHYETVLVERVHSIVPEKVWSKRYEQICAFEAMLAASGTTILKFFLHISKEEQKERFQARLDHKDKNWKFNVGDLAERKHWDEYQQAYEDALARTSTEVAPWYVVPSDRKWFRNWVLSDTIVKTLKALDLKYPKPDPDLAKIKSID